MPGPPRAVFLSYASQDADVAKAIADALRAAKIIVWLDQSELRGGDVWDAHIQRQIASCTLFLPIISAHSQGRREGYFRLEWRRAEDRVRRMALDTPFLVPVAVDDIVERDALVPRSFLDVHWVRKTRGGIIDADFVRLVQALLTRGTLRGETLLHVPRPSTAGNGPAPGDRSVVITVASTQHREPTGATQLSDPKTSTRMTVRPVPLAARDPAERRAALRILWLQVAIGVVCLAIALWSVLRLRG